VTWLAACSAWAAALFIQAVYGAAAAAIDADAGPCQDSAVIREITAT
jgi:hypothetical protein